MVVNDDIHGARAITKTHTTDVQTFHSPERGLIGTHPVRREYVFQGAVPGQRQRQPVFAGRRQQPLPRVDVLLYARGFLGRPHRQRGGQRGQGPGHRGCRQWQYDRRRAGGGAAGHQEQCRSGALLQGSQSGPTGRNVEINDDEVGTIASGCAQSCQVPGASPAGAANHEETARQSRRCSTSIDWCHILCRHTGPTPG